MSKKKIPALRGDEPGRAVHDFFGGADEALPGGIAGTDVGDLVARTTEGRVSPLTPTTLRSGGLLEPLPPGAKLDPSRTQWTFYPWSPFPDWLLRVLGNAHPDQAAEQGLIACDAKKLRPTARTHGHDLFPDEETIGFVFSTMSRWLRGTRRLVRVSPKSAELLASRDPRFHALPRAPMVEGESRPWKTGVMLAMEIDRTPALVYVEPIPEGMGVFFVSWIWGGKGWEIIFARPKKATREEMQARGEVWTPATGTCFTFLNWSLSTHSTLAQGQDGVRFDYKTLRIIAVNALAALYEDPALVVVPRQANQPKKASVGGVDRVKRLTLSTDGTRVLTRRWAQKDEGAEKVPRGEGERSSPGQHPVKPHPMRLWVRAPKPDEKVLGTRQKTLKSGIQRTYFLVKRTRGREGTYQRGSGLCLKEVRLVTGPADL